MLNLNLTVSDLTTYIALPKKGSYHDQDVVIVSFEGHCQYSDPDLAAITLSHTELHTSSRNTCVSFGYETLPRLADKYITNTTITLYFASQKIKT